MRIEFFRYQHRNQKEPCMEIRQALQFSHQQYVPEWFLYHILMQIHLVSIFQTLGPTFKQHVKGLSFEVYYSFLLQLALKLRGVESGSPEKVPGKGAFYYINHHNSGTFFGLTDSIARHFEASWGRKELHTSKESPITCRLKEVLKLEESLSWKAPDEF